MVLTSICMEDFWKSSELIVHKVVNMKLNWNYWSYVTKEKVFELYCGPGKDESDQNSYNVVT